MVNQAAEIVAAKPTMEIKLNGFALDIGEMSPRWHGTLRQTAKTLVSVAMERALEFGESHSVTIEIWDDDGKLLVTVLADIEATWPGSDM